jgi:hypothetical protein
MIRWFRKHFEQDDFRGDWYGWLTNQCSHIALGLFLAGAVSLIWFVMAGEMPRKWAGWAACLGLYLSLELVRGWHGWDSFEDTAFTAGYGSGGAFILFSEIRVGDPVLAFDLQLASGIASVAAGHLVWGVASRWHQ